jgi:RNA polymerase sigma-70 factor (ECF subfamily)
MFGEPPVARPTEPVELTRYLYEKYGQRVFTFCYSRLHNREEAQDAAQTTFIYVLRSLQRGVEPEFELAWLLKIAFNVCRGARRSSGRQTAATQEIEDMDELAAPAADYEGSERVAALRDGLAHLPERQRRGILLREWQGLSYAEIADELGLSVGAVETLLFRARRNLASRLQHVRGGVGAVDVASLGPFFRSLGRGGLGKLGLIGASASVAVMPVVATETTPALAHGKAATALRSIKSPGPPNSSQLATTPHDRAAAAGEPKGVLPAARQEQLRKRPVTATEAAEATALRVLSSPASGSDESAAATPAAPSISPLPLGAPTAGAVPVPVPDQPQAAQPPAALPAAASDPLEVRTSVLSRTPAAPAGLPVPGGHELEGDQSDSAAGQE